MKPHSLLPPDIARLCKSARQGFALVVTLLLMVVLAVVAVGLLTLSSIAMRSSAQSTSMAIARANARLALMLAIGELQKNAGPDQRVTARSDVLNENIANPRLTGVWKSWEIKATAPPLPAEYEKSARDAKFLGWLVSGTDPTATRQIDFASKASAAPVTLWGTGTLGAKAPATGFVSAAKVPLSASPGAFAWAVLDEGIKARVNTPFADGAAAEGAKTAQLGAGERPGIEFLPGLGALERKFYHQASQEFTKISKGISPSNFQLAAETLAPGTREALMPLAHDLTVHSLGLFTDTARGGLRQDFQLLTNSASLPAPYLGSGVYVSRLGMKAADVPSDPRWDSLHQFSRIDRDKIVNSSGVPVLSPQVPTGWQAATGTPPTVNLKQVPPGVLLLPTIAKVQMLFSLVGRDIYSYPPPVGSPIPADAPAIHEPQASHFRGTSYQYDLHLLYTPMVTLHNPYNVALDCSGLRVEFVHVPFAMQVFRNGVAQSSGLVPLETMTRDNAGGQQGKIFGMNLKDKTSDDKPGSTSFRLLPGEVKVFSPYIDPNRTYLQDLSDRKYWDIVLGTGLTTDMDTIPGWRGDGIGYDCDWLAGSQPVNGNAGEGHERSCYGLAKDDQIHVIFAPLSIPLSNNKFAVQMFIADGTSGSHKPVSVIEMDYESRTGLQDFLLGPGANLRYPKSGFLRGIDLVDHASTPIKDLKGPKPFALLSAQAKTTSGGRDAGKEDGRFATKPWCFAHANIGASSQKILSEHPSHHSHEIDLQLLDKGTANLVQIDTQDRGNFISGHTALNGTKFGGQYDIPLAPPQTFASLNGANPGSSSGLLPRFAQPIGNSWAHPLISSGKLLEARKSGNYPDHSFLLNLALYDGFYFSGLAAQTGPFASGKTTAELASDFRHGQPLNDPRLLLHRPYDRPAADLDAEVTKPDCHTRIAAWQALQGGFNINSTSVLAWKAMLASIHDSQAIYNQLLKRDTPPSAQLTPLPATATGHARISRLRLPVAVPGSASADLKDAYWLGPREYSDSELQKLAEHIVKQVRLRGPFLSLAEFVNRRLGSDDKAQRGALQQAIDDADLNRGAANAANAGFEIPAAAVATYKYTNPAAGAGPSYQGAPGFLTQADLLNVLGNAATARSDTFTIRGYGEARDAAGKILASAVCEAVLQRVPEWLDPADLVETTPAALASQANKTFGRRFLITSFRWLARGEI